MRARRIPSSQCSCHELLAINKNQKIRGENRGESKDFFRKGMKIKGFLKKIEENKKFPSEKAMKSKGVLQRSSENPRIP